MRWLFRVLAKLGLLCLALSLVPVLLFRWLPPPTSAVMLVQGWHDGALPDYLWRPLESLSPHLALAVVAAEDQNFPTHFGFDFAAIQDALAEYANGQRLRGASTLTQQVARNLVLWQGRSLLRKGLEAWFTGLIELLWPKRRILEVYLNIAELGPGTFGAEAASRRFFGRAAKELKPEQAALLAAVLPNPVRLRVDRPSTYVKQRKTWILRQMRQLGGTTYLDRIL